MVVLNKIYTKTGDAGETALGNGARVAKHSMRGTAYGTVDELNSFVGLAATPPEVPPKLKERLQSIQARLFEIGAARLNRLCKSRYRHADICHHSFCPGSCGQNGPVGMMAHCPECGAVFCPGCPVKIRGAALIGNLTKKRRLFLDPRLSAMKLQEEMRPMR